MPKKKERTQAKTVTRSDTVKPPTSLPDASPWERMTELTRRLLRVPKAEAVAPQKKRGH